MQPISEDCWMQTYSGHKFYPLDPHPEDIFIEDIAGALSNMCRFGGHCREFYSVAEHCVHVARLAPKELKLAALLHDAAEAYLVDIPRPIKRQLVDYCRIEAKLERVIAQRYSVSYPWHAEIKRLDTAILSDERAQNMANMDVEPMLWGNVLPALGVKLQFWKPQQAKFAFMDAFHCYR